MPLPDEGRESCPRCFTLPGKGGRRTSALAGRSASSRFCGAPPSGAQLAKNLSYGNQRLLEIARALATEPKLLILDEPAGGMNEQETTQLVALIRKIGTAELRSS